MRKLVKFCTIMALSLSSANAMVTLDGTSLDASQITRVANGEKIEITKEALQKVRKSHEVLIAAASSGHKIYGLTVGLGVNKETEMVNAKGELTQELIEASKKFNMGLLYGHGGGFGDDLPIKESRAIMVTRLNNMLFGGTGVQESVVKILAEMLNKNVIPAMPAEGSVGEADINTLSHIGLSMVGEGDVYYNGEKMPTLKAFKLANIKTITLFGKDALSIVSSNGYSAALAGLAIEELEQLTKASKYVYAISLEALNGNVTPIHKEAVGLRPYAGFKNAAEQIAKILKGSYIYDRDDEKTVHDPLSYRDSPYILGMLDTSLQDLKDLMKIQWNSSDDNPGVVIDPKASPDDFNTFQEKKVYVNHKGVKGAVVPVSNFEPIVWVVEFEKLGIVLGHNSMTSAQRILKLSDPRFTKLDRWWLSTDKTYHAFGAAEKPFAALTSINQGLSLPVSLNWFPIDGDIDDVATNAPDVLVRVRKQIENLYGILGMELLHAAQAIDLRKQKMPVRLSPKTQALYDSYRKQVKFLEVDRALLKDQRGSAIFLKNYKFDL